MTLNSTSVRVLWAAPLVPNGAVTRYSIYLDDQLYGSTDNTSGSLELGGLQPFTVYDIQVCPTLSQANVTQQVHSAGLSYIPLAD